MAPKMAAERGAGAKQAKTVRLTARRASAIVRRLRGLHGLPASLQELLRRVDAGLAAKGKRHLGREAATAILGKALRAAEASLGAQVREAGAAVAGSGGEREARIEAIAAAEAKLVELKQAVAEKKQELTSLAQEIHAKRDVLTSVKASQRSAVAEEKTLDTRKRRLEAVEKDAYEPLKQEPAQGSDGRKKLATLCKVGKEFGFHTELLRVLPAILSKQLDKRRTFDGLSMQQLEVEFARHAGQLQASVAESKQAAAERACDAQGAAEAVAAAREAHKICARELVQAEAAVGEGAQAITQARRCLRVFPSDVKRSERCLALAEARLEKFRKGPLASYEQATRDPAMRADSHSGQEAENSPSTAEEEELAAEVTEAAHPLDAIKAEEDFPGEVNDVAHVADTIIADFAAETTRAGHAAEVAGLAEPSLAELHSAQPRSPQSYSPAPHSEVDATLPEHSLFPTTMEDRCFPSHAPEQRLELLWGRLPAVGAARLEDHRDVVAPQERSLLADASTCASPRREDL